MNIKKLVRLRMIKFLKFMINLKLKWKKNKIHKALETNKMIQK